MFKFRKNILMIFVIVSIISLALSGCTKKEKGIVAKVNGDVITQEEFDIEFEIYKTMYKKQFGEDALAQEAEGNKTMEELLKENILEKLIIEKLILKEIKDMNITVTEEEVEKHLEDFINSLGGKEKYEEFLKKNGFSQKFVEDNIRKELLYEKHRENFMNQIELSEKELKDYYEKNKDSLIKVRVSHILVPTEEEGKKVLERLSKGEDFHSLAATESIDSNSAVKGGDLGYFTKGSMAKEFEEVAFSLEVGEISDLVKTELGYHIILLEDKIDTYEDLKEDIIPLLKNQKYIEKISKLRDKAKVKIYID
ncbi:foldase protein PrsA [Keratinibaculum paraultunense]|uniref:peptidylprolyl isomerase n=1 Tax=Keratinibaculum paraultunense TaxID=1278232 RepID=A0A4V2UTW4_9FIRM|nr:peptidylprolyl isomerase [Keratinibaculum paraultunense]QQY79495.1 peptidylprolyl isomerase [Keratinibaculum paraultunense]TCS88010.1 foldase protein PrsA [Keratinibaculum paraultunense]